MSIAIRAFRREWLGGAIESVLRQTWPDLELVVYDDARDLQDLVAQYDDPRLRYVCAEQEYEASGRFAAAVALCRGRYIGLLDDDDRYEPRFVERLVSALESDPQAGAAFCREVHERDGVRYAARTLGAPGRQPDVLRRILSERWVVAPSAMLLRREALEAASPIPDGVSPDVWVAFHLARAGWHHMLVDEVLLVRGFHDENIPKPTLANYALATIERLRTGDPQLETLRRRELARRYLARCVHQLAAGRRAEALGDVHAARDADPHAHRMLRHALRVAAQLPLLGPLAARAGHALRRRFRM